MSVGVELDCLKDIRVVDFTQFEAGPSCTESLAWLGAEVVKIENLRTGDPGRRRQPGGPDSDPWYFHQFNANKKSLTLNLKSARGLEIVRQLLKKADVTIENMAPGTIERLGLGYDEVKKINPGIIYCQVKGFGTGSPFEKNLGPRPVRAVSCRWRCRMPCSITCACRFRAPNSLVRRCYAMEAAGRPPAG